MILQQREAADAAGKADQALVSDIVDNMDSIMQAEASDFSPMDFISTTCECTEDIFLLENSSSQSNMATAGKGVWLKSDFIAYAKDRETQVKDNLGLVSKHDVPIDDWVKEYAPTLVTTGERVLENFDTWFKGLQKKDAKAEEEKKRKPEVGKKRKAEEMEKGKTKRRRNQNNEAQDLADPGLENQAQEDQALEDQTWAPNLACNDRQFKEHGSRFLSFWLEQNTKKLGVTTKFDLNGRKGVSDQDNRPDGHGLRVTERDQRCLDQITEKTAELEKAANSLSQRNNQIRHQLSIVGYKVKRGDFRKFYRQLQFFHQKKLQMLHSKTNWSCRRWQFVFILFEHTVTDPKFDEEVYEYWPVSSIKPTAAKIESKFLQQQRCSMLKWKYQPFLQFSFDVLLINGWTILVRETRSGVAASEPLDINNKDHRKVILGFFQELLVDESPKMLGYPPCIEKIGEDEHIWTFSHDGEGQWLIEHAIKPIVGDISRRTWRTVSPGNEPLYVVRDSLTGRNVFTAEVEQVVEDPTKKQKAFLKLEWAAMGFKVSTKEPVELTCEVDTLRLYEELDIPGHLKIIASGKLWTTEKDLSHGVNFDFDDKLASKSHERASVSAFGRQPPPAPPKDNPPAAPPIDNPPIPRKYSQPYVQRQACILITEFTKTFEEKIMEDPIKAHQAYPYWAFGALASEYIIHKTLGIIQGDFSFSNMRLKGEDIKGCDYSKETGYRTLICDWDLAESVEYPRKEFKHSGTPVFMSHDSIFFMDKKNDAYRKIFHHDIEGIWWGGNIAILKCLRQKARNDTGYNHDLLPKISDDEKIDSASKLGEDFVTAFQKAETEIHFENDADLIDIRSMGSAREVESEAIARPAEKSNDGVSVDDLNKIFNQYHQNCKQDYNNATEDFYEWLDLESTDSCNFEALKRSKGSLQSKLPEQYLDTWPKSTTLLKDPVLHEVWETIDLMAKMHGILNCSLKTNKPSSRFLKKRRKLDNGESYENAKAMEVLELLQEHLTPKPESSNPAPPTESGPGRSEKRPTFVDKVLSDIQLVESNKATNLAKFLKKYPSCAKDASRGPEQVVASASATGLIEPGI